MAILPLRLFSDPILHKPCNLITDFIGLDKIAEDLIDTMFAYRGVGLAANQVGLDKNICVMHLENKTKILILCNIKIICYTKEEGIQIEGCLSAPNISIPIKRFSGVEIEAQNLLGEKVNYKFEGYDSRILFHEWNHLQGRMITDNLIKL